MVKKFNINLILSSWLFNLPSINQNVVNYYYKILFWNFMKLSMTFFDKENRKNIYSDSNQM